MRVGTFVAVDIAVPVDLLRPLGVHADETNGWLLLLHFNVNLRNFWARVSFVVKIRWLWLVYHLIKQLLVNRDAEAKVLLTP